MIDFDHLLFNIEFDSRTPAPGALLVAEPFFATHISNTL